MRLFILTASSFAVPPAILYQKTLDIVMAGSTLSQMHFYVVGDNLPEYYTIECKLLNNVTLMTRQDAQKIIGTDTNSIVLHYGSTLKGAKQLKHYFFPLWLPAQNNSTSYWDQIVSGYRFKKFIQHSTITFDFNEWIHQSLLKKYSSLSASFKPAYVPYSTLPEFEWTHLSQTKETLTNGAPYFLSFIPLNNFVDTLKAFSIFKKWQQTTMAIVFIFNTQKQCEQALRLLKGYKYKDSVFIYAVQEVQIEWIAATYAALWGHDVDIDKTIFMDWAIHYEIPLLFDKNERQPISWEAAGEVLTFSDKLVLSDHFKLYYKDEVYRQARARMGSDWHEGINLSRHQEGLVKILASFQS